MNDLATLQAASERGERMQFEFFWGHTGGGVGTHLLSNWYGAPFEVDEVRYPTVEHWMMAEKARLFGDDKACRKILQTSSPAAVKAFGRAVVGFDEERWVEHRYDIVRTGVSHKFAAHPPLRNYLLKTKDRVLAEASPKDRIWGIGLDKSDPRAENPLLWRGLNLLGFALMDARDALAR